MKKSARRIMFMVLSIAVLQWTPAMAQLDEDAMRLLKKELDEFRMKERPPSTGDNAQVIEELKRRAEAQENEIRELKRELEALKKLRTSPEKPAWGKEMLAQLNSFRTTIARGVNIKTYMEGYSRLDSEIQRIMGGKGSGPIFEQAQQVLLFYQTAGDIWRWKLRSTARPDPKDRTIFIYQAGDPEVREWLGRYPFLAENILVKAQGSPRKAPGKFRANDAIMSLWDRAERQIEAIRNLLES
jgi:hypothetical protein